MAFPANPSNGMIFEDTPGVFFQYSSGTQSWLRISTPSIPLATPLQAGLMSSEDYKKLMGLLVPPPQITLHAGGCDFSSGLLDIRGDTDGIIKVDVHDDNLHENTAVIDLKLDVTKLAQKLTANGNIRFVAPQGDQGDQGDPGEDGANALPVGPQGPDGPAGKNAPWNGTLSEETFAVAQQDRAVVDISTECVSPTENYIVVTRANIGNPNACPDKIIPQDVQSPWILGFTGTGLNKIVNQKTKQVCSWSCGSSLYYFDIDVIIQTIRAQWTSYLSSIKAQKEALADSWLGAMIDAYNTQKSALCCALEAAKSRARNVDTRRYIESQAIQAMLGGYKLKGGADNNKVTPPTAEWNIPATNSNIVHLSNPDCVVDTTGSSSSSSSGSPGTGGTMNQLFLFAGSNSYQFCVNFHETGTQIVGQANAYINGSPTSSPADYVLVWRNKAGAYKTIWHLEWHRYDAVTKETKVIYEYTQSSFTDYPRASTSAWQQNLNGYQEGLVAENFSLVNVMNTQKCAELPWYDL